MEFMNNSKNKLNNKIILIFNQFPNAHQFSLACKFFITYKTKINYNQLQNNIKVRLNKQIRE